MQLYIYFASLLISLSILILCLEAVVCLKNGCIEREKARYGSVAWTFKICVILLLIFGVLLSGYQTAVLAEPDYYSIAFPLVDRQTSKYAYDIEFVKPNRSDLYEVIGYSGIEKLFLTITNDTHEVHFFPDTDYTWYLNIAKSPDNIDGFIGGWAEGLISPNDQYTPF